MSHRSLRQKARPERGEERREKNIILKCEPWPKTREEEEEEEEEEKGRCGELTALEEKNSSVCERAICKKKTSPPKGFAFPTRNHRDTPAFGPFVALRPRRHTPVTTPAATRQKTANRYRGAQREKGSWKRGPLDTCTCTT